MRFYGINPLGYPLWLLGVLQRSIPLLRAEEAIMQADAGRLAGAKASDYKKGRSKLVRAATPFDNRPVVVMVAPQMAWWFEREGIPHRVSDEG